MLIAWPVPGAAQATRHYKFSRISQPNEIQQCKRQTLMLCEKRGIKKVLSMEHKIGSDNSASVVVWARVLI